MTIVTLGLFLLVINAGMVALVAWMLPGMHVAGFWSAFWASVIVSLVSFVAHGSWAARAKSKSSSSAADRVLAHTESRPAY